MASSASGGSRCTASCRCWRISRCTSRPICGWAAGSAPSTESKAGPLGSAAVGLRFFTHQKGGITLEVRNYLYPDSYLVNIDRTKAEASGDPNNAVTGDPAQSPGLTALWMFDIGYTYIF